jgi:hypothetical protein
MKIVYDDLEEFLVVSEHCKETAKAKECAKCPLYDICDFGDNNALPAVMENIDG